MKNPLLDEKKINAISISRKFSTKITTAILMVLVLSLFAIPGKTLALSGAINSIIRDMECSGCSSSSTSGSSDTSSSSSNTSSTDTPTPRPSCSLSANSGDVLVNFETSFGLRADNTLARSQKYANANIPTGKYDIRIMTWDAHSVHGGQNQYKEQTILKLLNSGGNSIYTTNRSLDIPENADSQISTIATNATLNERITRILAYHPEYPSSNPESLVPICAVFEKIDAPTPPPPPPEPDYPEVECVISDNRVEEGDYVSISAEISGGNSPYDVEWSGDIYDIDDFDRYDRYQTVRMEDEGRYDLDVEVIDEEGYRDTDTCTIYVDEEEDEDDLDIECKISDRRIEVGDRVTIEVDIDGGESPYDIEWYGDADEIDDFDLDDDWQIVRIDDEGTYRLRVEVEDDDGNRETDSCTIYVEDDDDDYRNVSVVSSSRRTPDGQLAGLSSVYLNQVPYTGPEDTLKIIGFGSLILIWSSLVGYYFLRGKKRRDVSARINAFKEANKERVQV